MKRIPTSHERVQDLVSKLLPYLMVFGSIRELASRLNSSLNAQGLTDVIHPNRLRAVLSEDPAQAVNSATVNLIEKAIVKLPAADATALAAAVESLTKQILSHFSPGRGLAENVGRVAGDLGIPAALVKHVLNQAGISGGTDSSVTTLLRRRPTQPDWSFQDEAVGRCIDALLASAAAKIGAVLPTGAGKTRIGLRIGLQLLAGSASENGRVLWVTHRRHLRRQAHRELQKLLKAHASGLPHDAAKLLAERVHFVMVSELESRLNEPGPPILAVIVDEGHHVAAAGYAPVFNTAYPLRALLLTATPNRTDGLPLGIDRIAFSITYRELAERGAIMMPEFVDFPVENFDWQEEDVRELAEEIIDKAAGDFVKMLVLAPRVARVEEFHKALINALAEASGHPLSPDDVGYVHSGGNSLNIDTDDFLAVFADKPRGIIVSAQMLLEGFDDPAINAVVVTYPSQSLITLMQAAGRCVRYAEDKTQAFVMQATNPDLAYRFDQRWLYCEISDMLRPALVDRYVQTVTEREAMVRQILSEHAVSEENTTAVLNEIRDASSTDMVNIFLYGLPYFGDKEKFSTDAAWGAIAITSANRETFRRVFNDFCAAGADLADTTVFLRQVAQRYTLEPGTQQWRLFAEMLTSMYLAKKEIIDGEVGDPLHSARPFVPHHASTWLKYYSVECRQTTSPALTAFLQDCYNRDAILAALVSPQADYALLIKIPVPLDHFEAHLLRGADALEFQGVIAGLREEFSKTPPVERFGKYGSFLSAMGSSNLPRRVLDRLEIFLPEQGWSHLTLKIEAAAPALPAS